MFHERGNIFLVAEVCFQRTNYERKFFSLVQLPYCNRSRCGSWSVHPLQVCSKCHLLSKFFIWELLIATHFRIQNMAAVFRFEKCKRGFNQSTVWSLLLWNLIPPHTAFPGQFLTAGCLLSLSFLPHFSTQLANPDLVEGLVLINIDTNARGWIDWAAQKVRFPLSFFFPSY